jgi:aminoglycoside phosphotransferase (APT) family kinase protein
MPDSLVHGDLHPGNAASDARRTTIYDWSDTATGAPVLDAFMLARHLEGEDRARAVAAYAGRWRQVAPDADVEDAIALAAVPNDAYQVVTYDAILRGQEELSRWELAGVAPRILRRMLETHAAG